MIKTSVLVLAALLAAAFTAGAQTGNLYLQTNLVSNTAGVAAVTDPNLVDPWGVSFSGTSPFWVSDHLSGLSTLYNGAGAITATVVTVPKGSASAAGALGRPTGQVNNGTATAFLLANGKAASFIFATEDGTISGWNGGTIAEVKADNSPTNAVYKGLAIGTSTAGATLYAANFRSGKIDVFGPTWATATLAGSFADPSVPSGFAPFNIWNLNGSLYVTWARQDFAQFQDVAAAGNGYVSVFDLNGNLISHLISGGALNSPWGVAIAPAGWGAFGGDVLVGNFGDGRINAFDPKTGALLGALKDANGNIISLPGLWAIVFGNGGRGGDYNTLYFFAGVSASGSSAVRGLIGSLAPPAAITSVVNAASQTSGPVSPGEIVVINGQSVGPSPLVGGTIPAAGGLSTALGPVSATFNGIAAPVYYANGSQTSVQVPYEVSGAASVSVILKNGAQTTAAFTVPVAATAPGLFTIDFSGKNEIVALNVDGSVNSTTNRAIAGSMIWIFATGEGMTSPAETDGAVQKDMTRIPVAPVSVAINGVTATLGPDGSTPKDVSGVLEMQVTIPPNTPSGAASVKLTIGGITTTQATTVFVQ